MGESKLTDEQKEELVHRYIASRADPYAEPITQKKLAEEYGISQAQVSRTIQDSGIIERVRRRTKSSVMIAQAIAEEAAANIMRESVSSAFKHRDEKYEYINQGDRRDILDRAGVRAASEEKPEVNITFNGSGVPIGVPKRSGE